MNLELVQDLSMVNGIPVVSSLTIAERFGKQHKNVLQSVRNLTKDLPEDFNGLNFQPAEYSDEKGQARPAFNLTRDAFSLLVMGFTGPEAIRWKLNFIAAFNGLERLALEARQREHDEQLRLEARRDTVDALSSLSACQYAILPQALKYRDMGLNAVEISKLLGCSKDVVRRALRPFKGVAA